MVLVTVCGQRDTEIISVERGFVDEDQIGFEPTFLYSLTDSKDLRSYRRILILFCCFYLPLALALLEREPEHWGLSSIYHGILRLPSDHRRVLDTFPCGLSPAGRPNRSRSLAKAEHISFVDFFSILHSAIRQSYHDLRLNGSASTGRLQ